MTGALVMPAGRRSCRRLPDGRVLAWHEWGRRTDRPVLFCTGAAMSGALGVGHDVLDPLGVRLLAVDRPGLGASSPDPVKSLATWVDDVTALLEATALERPHVVGFSQGGPFALALAAEDLVASVALVSAQDELRHPVVAALLPDAVAAMVHLAHRDPATLARDIASVASAAWLQDLVVGTSSAPDRAFCTSASFAAAYGQCRAEGFRQGVDGYVQDLLAALGPWPFRPEDVAVPVALWYGAHDASPVHSPDHGAPLAARLPRATRTVIDDAGGALLWTHASAILARLLGHVVEAP
jgi:pimeloyl-ACP methyl ester carboxylesterase